MADASSLEDSTVAIDEPPMEVDNDFEFLGHRLTFARDNDLADEQERNKAVRDYEVIDPRVRGAQAKEEERDRKRRDKERRGGGRGEGGGKRTR